MTEEERIQRRRESARKYRQKKKEEIKQKKHEYYLKHKDDPEEERIQRRRESALKWYNKHKDEAELKAKYKARNYKYREEHAEEFKEYCKQYHKAHYEDKKKNSVPVVYGYTDENDYIVYIGSSMCLENRIHARVCSSKVEFDILYRENPDKFELFIFQKCKSIEEARDIEKKLIWEIKPKYNKQYNNC